MKYKMNSRDILAAQDLEYQLSLIADMERESREELEQTNQAEASQEASQEATEVEDQRNPSPRTLRNMRRAYFEAMEITDRVPIEPDRVPIEPDRVPIEPDRVPIEPDRVPIKIQSIKSDRSNPIDQIQSTGRRLRSGRSY